MKAGAAEVNPSGEAHQQDCEQDPVKKGLSS
jgi:hypothetical protein